MSDNCQSTADRQEPTVLVDADARRDAVNPARNVVLEASAGTGKTRVLVERYVNLLRAGVDPDHILAITFTRKAAAEMRERIIDQLREASRLSEIDRARWRDLKERFGDIAISTIDAFCLSLLREFPLEADVDPGFELVADTELPRLVNESLTQALRVCRAEARNDDGIALVFAQLGERRLRAGLGSLLDRRLVARDALRRYLDSGPKDLTSAVACRRAAQRLQDVFRGVQGSLGAFLDDGPVHHPQFAMLSDDIRRLCADVEAPSLDTRPGQAAFRALTDRLAAYFLTQEGRPRGERFAGTGFAAGDCNSEHAWKRHRLTGGRTAPSVAEVIRGFRRDLNVVMSRGVWRIFAVALAQYRRTLESRALLDFSGVLERAVRLLRDLDEFAQSRFRLEARYRHVLVDEFQDTSRAQWDLVAELVRSWGEGFGAGADALPPSIFIVGDRKQSIYGFRDADVLLLDEATRLVEGLRPDGDARRAISVSFRAVPELLAFVNDVFSAIEKSPDRADAFRYEEMDRFSVEIRPQPDLDLAPLGMIVGKTVGVTADRVANEVVRLLSHATVHDRATRLPRPVQPADVVLLTLLRETAYAYETRGPGRPQARENFKKLRGMVARFQNRGYATLARVADHLDQLAVGDESNAAIDAKDAVSLMTVHAAKGLEFPIVFVVNMGRGTTAARAPIRATCNSAGEPSVAIADYQSEADEDAQARDREETARLLYVALTRARDRLCLSATTQQGSCRMGRGSLGEVLPASLKVLFAEAAIGRTAVVGWPGSDGQMHRFIVPGRC